MSDEPRPFFSIVIPTEPHREWSLPLSIAGAVEQENPGVPVELVVVGDGFADGRTLGRIVANAVTSRLPLPMTYSIHALTEPMKPAGAKWNASIAKARGEWVLLWGDDDWHAPRRLRKTLEAIQAEPGLDMVGDRGCIFHELVRPNRTFQFTYPTVEEVGGDPYMTGFFVGGTVAVRRAYWERHPFPTVYSGGNDTLVAGSDSEWIANAIRHHGCRWRDIGDPTMLVAMRHGENVSGGSGDGDSFWKRWPGGGQLELNDMMGGALSAFQRRWDVREVPHLLDEPNHR